MRWQRYPQRRICGIIALLDGKATPENLWQSKKAAGDKSAIYYIGNAMVTKETYKDYFAQIEETLGLEK